MYTEDRSRLVELLGVVVKESSPHGEMPEAAEPLAKALIGAILYNDPLFFGGAVTSLLRQLIEEARSHNTWVTEEEWRRAEVLALLLGGVTVYFGARTYFSRGSIGSASADFFLFSCAHIY